MKIAILHVCTGKYTIFWKDFYLSCEENFVTEAEKHYFVFTDSPEIDFEKTNKNIHRIYQNNLGWPDNTLMRYSIFLRVNQELEKMDYIFFFNANLIFVKKISAEEILPAEGQKLVGCLHPGYYDKPRGKFTYEGNPKSTAYIDKSQGVYYFAGGINGGLAKPFLETIQILDINIKRDKENKIIAKWHDESHWNWYLNNHLDIVKILTPAYLYYSENNLPFEAKILLIDKKTLGGHSKFRNKTELKLILNSLKTFIKKVIKSNRT
ncbi:MAG: family 6 glucosyltransferase [bacterium]